MVAEQRLQKYISSSGMASRREAERMILKGRVSVNGKVVATLGVKIDPHRDEITLDQKRVKPVGRKIYLMMNKPRNVISTISDPQGRTTIVDYLGNLAQARGEHRIFHIGRLDYASEGLLLLTNDGNLAHKMSHPSSQVPRTYRVKVCGNLSKEVIAKIAKGVNPGDGVVSVLDIQIIKYNPKSTWVELTVCEGRNRLVRRLMEAVGLSVQRLQRISYGGIDLGDLQPGEIRELLTEELDKLKPWR